MNPPPRRPVQLATLALVLGVAPSVAPHLTPSVAPRLAGATAARENVLLIVADDFGVESFAPYTEALRAAGGGAVGEPIPTPNLDRLAARGVVFRNAWSTPLCSPTRASLQTGRHGVRLGLGPLHGRKSAWLADDEVTLAELLARGGRRADGSAPLWSSAYVGKWHLADDRDDEHDPEEQGYAHFAGVLNGAVRDYYAWDQVVDGEHRRCTRYATSEHVDAALAWLATAESPWFLTVAFNAPHWPFHAPPAALHDVDLAGLDPERTPRPFYEAMVEAMDAEIGRLLAGVETLEPGALARTNVFFLGDNGTPTEVAVGPYSPDTVKQSLSQGGIHVPLVVAGPAVAEPGRSSLALAHVVDVFPTLAELAGIDPRDVLPPGRALDGVSLVPVLRGTAGAAGPRERCFTERLEPNAYGSLFEQGYAYRDERYKLIVEAGRGPDRFYDLREDPFERRDLAAAGFPGAGTRERYETLKSELVAYLTGL